MDIEKLQDKYPTTIEKSDPVDCNGDLESWKHSASVTALSEFLKAHRQHGCRLIQLDGRPTIHFEPGLDPSQTERWQFAETVMDLVETAKPDLEYLWQCGHLPLPRRGSF